MRTRTPTQHRSSATDHEVDQVHKELLALRSTDRAVNIVITGALLSIEALHSIWDRNPYDYGDDVIFFLGRLTAGVDTLEAVGIIPEDQTRLCGGTPLHLLPV